MTTHDNAPPPPDWMPDPATERCIACNSIRVSCEAEVAHGSICCGFCSHGFTSPHLKLPAGWDGDQN